MPKRVDPEEQRQRIAVALLEVAAREGLEGVSVRHVAAQAGVTSGMVQHWFPSKDAMMGFAMRSASARYAARVDAALAHVGPDAAPAAVIGAVLAALLPQDEEQRRDARVALAFQSYAACHPSAAEGLSAESALLSGFLADQLRRHVGDAADPSAVDRAALVLLAMTDGLGTLVVSTGLAVDTAAAALSAQVEQTLQALDG